MTKQDLESFLGSRYLPIELGDTISKVLDILGHPESVFEQKKYKVKIFKYGCTQVSLQNDIIVSIVYLFPENNSHIDLFKLKDVLFQDKKFEILFQGLYYQAIVNGVFKFVFDRDDNCLKSIRIE